MRLKLKDLGLSPRAKYRIIGDVTATSFAIAVLLLISHLYKPERPGFHCDDNTIKYPYLESTVPSVVIVTVTLIFPIVVIALTEVQTRFPRQKQQKNGDILRPTGTITETTTAAPTPLTSEHTVTDSKAAAPRNASKIITFCCGRRGLCKLVGVYVEYFWGWVVMTVIVVLVKRVTKQLRPHFLDLCKPDALYRSDGILRPVGTPCQGYVSEFKCTNPHVTEKQLLSAQEAFPSGHAAYAMYMALFSICHVECRLGPLYRSRVMAMTWQAALTSYALWVGGTRVGDNMHHMRDVLGGWVLGAVIALLLFTPVASLCRRLLTTSGEHNTSYPNLTKTPATGNSRRASSHFLVLARPPETVGSSGPKHLSENVLPICP